MQREKEMTDYRTITAQAEAMLDEEPWYTSALSNISALIMESVSGLNWAGFYLMRNGRLVVGPFQGKPACIHIPAGRGVCGTAVQKDSLQVVPDVHAFPGHIACDSASASEIVIPIHGDEEVIGVLDIDSPVLNRFSDEDAKGLQRLVEIIEEKADWRE